MAEAPKQTANLLRTYLRDASLESPNTPGIFTATGESQFKLEVNVTHRKGDNDHYEVTLTLSAKATMGDQTMFLVEVQQAGLLHIVGIEGDALDSLLGAWTPQQLYPFAREAVSTLSMHAGFPQVMLPMVNFEQFYQQNRAAKAAGAGVTAPADPPAGSAH
ncbi:MAG: protein-export chaperone SecB [Gammaproteobacteria bacterium]